MLTKRSHNNGYDSVREGSLRRTGTFCHCSTSLDKCEARRLKTHLPDCFADVAKRLISRMLSAIWDGSKMKYTKYTILILFLITLEIVIFIGCRKDVSEQVTPKITESDTRIVSDFTAPDQSAPERTLRTFWWAIKNGKNDIALACVDRKKVAEGHHSRDIDKFISEFSPLDTGDFRFIVSETKVSIQSIHHCMDYDMEKGGNGKWVIVSIHP